MFLPLISTSIVIISLNFQLYEFTPYNLKTNVSSTSDFKHS
jgi:hypothetical protein